MKQRTVRIVMGIAAVIMLLGMILFTVAPAFS